MHTDDERKYLSAPELAAALTMLMLINALLRMMSASAE